MDPLSAANPDGIVLVGLSHHTAPLAVREQVGVQPERLVAVLTSLGSVEGVEECWVLSTCNRTEVLLVGRDLDALARTAANLLLRAAEPQQLYRHQGLQALIHLFRVAAGLDSLVLGESQILGQIKAATGAAREAGTLGKRLHPLLEQALSVGKRVRNQTAIGTGTLSVARVAIDLGARVFGSYRDCRALILGAGETGLLVAQHLCEGKVGSLVFANRSAERAETAARRFGARWVGLEGLRTELTRSDLVVACVDGAGQILGAELFPRRLESRDRPMLVLDLSVPRAVDPRCGQMAGLLHYDLDDLARVVEQNRASRERATEGTAEILVAEVHKYLALRSYAAASPWIAELRSRFDEVRESTLDEAAGDRSAPEQVRLAHELTRRLLDVALAHLKETFRRAKDPAEVDLEYQRYLERRAGEDAP